MPKINKQMKRLQDAGYPVKSVFDIVQNDNETNTIVYTSKEFQPCSETFSEKYHFIGPSIRPITETVEKTAKTTIYISMGTVNKNEEFYRNCIEVLKNTDYQVIISLGTNTDSFGELPENIQIYESVDQMAVLSISDVFITHCGMNSVSEGLYFEVPLILFPQTSEQGAVAKRVEEMGAGILLKDNMKNNAKGEISKAILQILNTTSYKENAIAISQSFKNSGGVAEARSFIESFRN
ncbi:MAG: glycosyltransferase [Butyribacter sp.]|nr:glycosyltransferase [Butyribacter sp.]